MRQLAAGVAIGAVVAGAGAGGIALVSSGGGGGSGHENRASLGGVTLAAAFPDAHDGPPTGWTGPVFHLSQSYPATRPAIGTAPWRQLSFKTQPVQYLKAVLDYALEGNTQVDFRGQDNATRKWFHAPWMHFGPKGREFIHGLTKERQSPVKELAPTQTKPAQTWAVSMYNPRGGYTLGRVWKNPNAPDPSKAKFPEGTVAFKLLFTTATVSQVPYLKNSLEWQADINRSTGIGARPTVRLLQIDLAVRDKRANSTTGWVFGTFIYNGKKGGATVWDRVVPVGLMWGNDPNLLNGGGALKETIITNPGDHPVTQHLGYKGRLNGPLDNPRSSCMSCHSTAQIPSDLSKPTVPGLVPANADAATLAKYFRNIMAGDPFTVGELALDYSLQLQNGLANRADAGAAPGAHGIAAAAGPGALHSPKRVRVKPVAR